MPIIDGGEAESTYTAESQFPDACYPDNAIYPDPSIIPVAPAEDATEQEVAAYELALMQFEIATLRAWTTLQVLSAYQIAICPVTVRPCAERCSGGSYFIAPVDGPWGAPFWPLFIGGGAVNILLGCSCSGDCSCSWTRDVRLPGPVGAIARVELDGVTLDPSAYRVDNGNRLVREDGEGWPFCQNMNLPLGEVGTFGVTYWHGATSDVLVRYAAGVLATEYLAAMMGGECRLPSGVTQVIRQGVTFEVEKDMFESGLTGIDEVDSVTARYNPFRVKLPAQVYSLDDLPPRRTTYPTAPVS